MTSAVVLCDFPVLIWSGVRQWFEEVRREVSLVGFSHQGAAASGLAALTDLLRRQSRSTGRASLDTDLWQALERGQDRIDVTYHASPEAVATSGEMLATVTTLDELCRSGTLLTLPLTADELAMTRWVFAEFQSQLAGAPPLPWPGPWVRSGSRP